MYRPSFKPATPAVDIGPYHPEEDSFKEYGTTQQVKPTGNYDRYFIESIVDKSIVEITAQEYQREIDSKKIYKKYKLNWETASPLFDFLEGSFVRLGSNSKNIEQVKQHTSLFEYLAKKGEIVVEYLEALPKQFILSNGDFYIGLYHIHPQGGTLADPVHTSNPHKVLYSPATRPNPYLQEVFTSPAVQYDRAREGNYRASL